MLQKIKTLLFQNLSLKQTIAKNIFWLSLGQVGSRLIRAVIIIYAARVLGAAGYGVFSYVLSFAGLFTAFGDLGINPLLTRETANHPEGRNEYFVTSFWIKIFLLFLISVVITLIVPHLTNIEKASIFIPFVILLVVFDNIREMVQAYFRGLEKMERETFIVIIMNVIIVISGFIILKISPFPTSLLWAYILSVGLATMLAIFILREKFAKIFTHFKKNLLPQIINNSWPIALSSVLGVFMINTDVVMIGWWRTPAEIGYYSAGQRVIQVLYILPALLASSVFPTLSRLVKGDSRDKEKKLSETVTTIAFAIAIPMAIGGIILGQPIIQFVFGKEYLPGTIAFQFLLGTVLLIFPATLLSNLVLAHNQQRKVFYYVAAGSLGNIVFNALLIPIYGIAGAAIATVVAQFLNYFLTWRWMRKITEFRTLVYLKKIIASSIIMGILSFIFNKFGVNVILNIAVSAAIYLGALCLLKEEIIKEAAFIFKAIKS